MTFHPFSQPTIARINRFGTDQDGDFIGVSHGDCALLGFYLERDKANKLRVVYVDKRGVEFPTAMGFWVKFHGIEADEE